MAPTNKIVINYDEAKLVYLGTRDVFTGEYSWNSMTSMLFEPVPHRGTAGNLVNFVAKTRAETAGEGYIIRFEDGMMVKVKNDWYVRVHKTLDDVRSDRAIVTLGLNEELDDVLPLIPEEDRSRVENVFHTFMEALNKKQILLTNLKKMIFEVYMQDPYIFENPTVDKKRLALELVPTMKDKRLAKFVFSLADGKEPRDLLLTAAKNSLSTGVKYDEFFNWLNM